MEILYFWIKKFKNINNTGFNFSNRYCFSYNLVSNTLLKKDYEMNLDEFFSINSDRTSNVCNLSAIIGENGSGKTNILRFIINLFIMGHEITYSDFFVILNENSKLILYQKNIDVKNETSLELRICDYENKFDSNKDFNLLYYSNIYQPNINQNDVLSIERKNYYNISTNYLITHDIINYYNSNKSTEAKDNVNNAITVNYFQEMRRQIKLISEKRNIDTIFYLPKFLAINIDNSDEMMMFSEQKDMYKQIGELLNQLSVRFKNLEKEYESSKEKKYKILLSKAFVFNIMRQYLSDQNFHMLKDINIFMKLLYNTFIKTEKLNINTIFDFIENVVEFNSNDKYEFQITGFEEEQEFFKELIEKVNTNTISKNGNQIFIDDFNFVEKYFKNPRFGFFNYLNFDWAYEKNSQYVFSYGEYIFLSLISRIYSIIDSGRNESKNLIITIDEGELGFHPQWQKKYVRFLIDFVEKVFDNKQIQFIISSHSPIVISDIPNFNLILLKKDGYSCELIPRLEKNEETFGANIFSLFTDTFFIKDGVIGDFAKIKINGIINFLNDENFDRYNSDEIYSLISIIGEPVIKEKLMQMFLNKYGNDYKIKYYEKEIERLKQEND